MTDFDVLLGEFAEKFETIGKNIESFALKSIEGKEEVLADLNRTQMFLEGIRSDGSDIEPPYTNFTVQLKQEKGQRTDHVTLRDTKDFHDSIVYDLNPFEGNIGIDATDVKTPDLIEKYGIDILGLTDENITRLVLLIEFNITEELEKFLLN